MVDEAGGWPNCYAANLRDAGCRSHNAHGAETFFGTLSGPSSGDVAAAGHEHGIRIVNVELHGVKPRLAQLLCRESSRQGK